MIATFPGTDADARHAAYRQAADPKTWLTTPLATNVTILSELKANLAAFDAVDAGLVVSPDTLPGCTNALIYHPPTNINSYTALANLLGDDELYLDTAKATCTRYFSLEIEMASSNQQLHATCGGRTLSHDALDDLISVTVSGLTGVDPGRDPLFRSAATVHADITDNFPYLGPPNP